jgi:hypothetical protein
MLTLPNVKVNIHIPSLPSVLDSEGSDAGPAQFRNTNPEDQHHVDAMVRRLQRRDWRLLRSELLNTNLGELDRAAAWLNKAGYLPESRLNRILPAHFAVKDVKPPIVRALKSLRDAVEIAMELSDEDFNRAVRRVHAYDNQTIEAYSASGTRALADTQKKELKKGEPYTAGRTLPHPARKFMSDPRKFLKDAGAPPELIDRLVAEERESEVASQLERIFRGAGSSGVLASFAWEPSGIAAVTIHIASPIDAILLSVQIDRNFSKCTMVCCPCGHWFNRKRGKDRFHSDKCRNLFTTRDRRAKIKLLKDGLAAWETLAAARRRGRNRSEWITEWATAKGRENDPSFTIEAEWAQKELSRERKGGN